MKRLLLFFGFLMAWSASVFADLQKVEHNGTIFYTYTVAPKEVGLYWADAAGQPFRQFAKLQAHLAAEGKRLRFIMNGGLFEDDGAPCGLLVIDGKTLKPLNLKDAPGNFYLKPNGVFFIDGKGAAHIVPSTEYEAHPSAAPRLAIQSGPLLLHNGKVHPAFRPDSTNRLHRNGVGVRKDGKVVFAITGFEQAKRVTLYEFAEFFRSQGCENALFLDGDISRMLVDPEGAMVPGNFYGTIFAVTAPAK